jgi:lipoprotein-releasing system ATP-binding protein
MNESAPAIVELQRVKKVFRSGHENLVVFEEVSLSVAPGRAVVISGESGSGKTTLLNLMGALDSCSAGRIVFAGRDITEEREENLIEFRSRHLGFIFQFHYLLKNFTALENVLIPALIAGRSGSHGGSQAHRRAQELLAQVGLSARMDHYPVQLSGGERQRVAVARALMNDPQLILADEPTGNLDEGNSRTIQELLFKLVRAHGKTMILVTHAANFARAGDEHYVLEHRRLRRL